MSDPLLVTTLSVGKLRQLVASLPDNISDDDVIALSVDLPGEDRDFAAMWVPKPNK